MDGCTPLHHAVEDDTGDTVQLLLEAGVDWRRLALNSETALSRARRLGCEQAARRLEAAERMTESESAAARAALQLSLETERRALARDRLDLIRAHAYEICVGLQTLELPAFITLTIIEQACDFARLATMHQIWRLVTAIKHFPIVE
jgi:hypothetical protein